MIYITLARTNFIDYVNFFIIPTAYYFIGKKLLVFLFNFLYFFLPIAETFLKNIYTTV